jgi:hypothetical protein
MSLKLFHILFVGASTLLAFGFGGWSLYGYFAGGGSDVDLKLGLGAVAAGVALIVYGKYVFKKLKLLS